jgi:Spy/CpxP family protein refolding chaperone
MTSKLLLTALLLTAVPCAFSQITPPPADTSAPAPVVRAHDHRDFHGKPDDRDGRGMRGRGMERGRPGGDMHGRGMAGGGEMHGSLMRLLPEGPWWRSTEIATRIGLTADQTKRIDDIFLQSRVQLIDLHASLEKEQLLLEPLLNANPVEQSKALAQIGKIADTRADLEKTNAKMLLSIRAVLNADQWTKLQDRGRGPRGGEMGPGQRGPRGPHGPRGPKDQPGPPAPPQ